VLRKKTASAAVGVFTAQRLHGLVALETGFQSHSCASNRDAQPRATLSFIAVQFLVGWRDRGSSSKFFSAAAASISLLISAPTRSMRPVM
jgi:hypothetical protein